MTNSYKTQFLSITSESYIPTRPPPSDPSSSPIYKIIDAPITLVKPPPHTADASPSKESTEKLEPKKRKRKTAPQNLPQDQHKRNCPVPTNKFRESAFRYYGETCTIFCALDYFRSKRMSQKLLSDQGRAARLKLSSANKQRKHYAAAGVSAIAKQKQPNLSWDERLVRRLCSTMN